MSDQPSSASVVVIGAGIVGNSVVHHLAQLGWRDIVQVDKGPLPNPGGSTGHASNFIFPVDHNKEMTALTLDSQGQYEEMGVNTSSGGIEVARTEARMEELRRRMTSATTWGIESHLLSPAEVKERVPFINKEILLGGFYTPSVSVVDSLQAGTLMRESAMSLDALTVSPNTEVLDIETSAEVSRLLVWAGLVSTQDRSVGAAVWHSEEAGFETRSQGTHHAVTIPARAREACRQERGCVLIVQALRHEWTDEATLVLSEGRLVGVTP